VELEPDAREDGRLEVHEILGLRLKADLVVLSACDTALGSGYLAEVPSGDDIVGLTRAFMFAGSPSVIASLWAVNDQSTMRLMRAFYGRLVPLGKAARSPPPNGSSLPAAGATAIRTSGGIRPGRADEIDGHAEKGTARPCNGPTDWRTGCSWDR